MHYPEVTVVDIETPGQIDGDPEQLEQVVISLLENARRHSTGGSRVRVLLRSDGSGVLLQVEYQDLGLHNCRQIVQQHGGRIWAESEGDGRGRTFNVWLPSRPRDCQDLATSARPRAAPRRTSKSSVPMTTMSTPVATSPMSCEKPNSTRPLVIMPMMTAPTRLP